MGVGFVVNVAHVVIIWCGDGPEALTAQVILPC